MKLKSLAVMAVLVLGCCSAAFAQTYTFGFNGSCEYETITVAGSFAAGTDVLTGCGNPTDAVLVGFKVTLPVTSGAVITGPLLLLADSAFDAEFQSYTGCQDILLTKTKASSKKLGWAVYFGCLGEGMYLGNYGYLTNVTDASRQVEARGPGALALRSKRK